MKQWYIRVKCPSHRVTCSGGEVTGARAASFTEPTPYGMVEIKRGFLKVGLEQNDSANWVTISDVKANNVKVNYETIMIAPLESQSINVKSNNANNWYLTIIDDHGNYISDKI